jgi:hypothetical protein
MYWLCDCYHDKSSLCLVFIQYSQHILLAQLISGFLLLVTLSDKVCTHRNWLIIRAKHTTELCVSDCNCNSELEAFSIPVVSIRTTLFNNQ